jgi:hypothetical protein
MWGLAALSYPEGRKRAMDEVGSRTAPSSKSKFKTTPDDQLLCFDFLYFVCTHEVNGLPENDEYTMDADGRRG